jgi:hypothetical protein
MSLVFTLPTIVKIQFFYTMLSLFWMLLGIRKVLAANSSYYKIVAWHGDA